MKRPEQWSRNPLLTTSAKPVMRAILRNVHNRTVNLSTARSAYIAWWDGLRPLVSAEVVKKSGRTYELKECFYALFRTRLKEVVIQHFAKPNKTNGDLLAMALLRAAIPFEKYKTLREEPRVTKILDSLIGCPLPKQITFELAEDPTGPPNTYMHLRSGKLQLRANAGQGKRARETLYLRVRGEPVQALTRMFFLSTAMSDYRRSRIDAKRVLKAVFVDLAKMIGAAQEKRGRPIEARLRKAAPLRETFGYSWRQIAELLCPEEHQHTVACKERFRKGVEQMRKR